jgi:hypothetical protein
VSCLRVRDRDLRTLLNTGVLGPGEQRRPAAELYPLERFPAAAALVAHRRPYLFTSDVAADSASAALEARLEKTSQAAVPLVVGEHVWGELWVASTRAGLPLDRTELPLISWAGKRFGLLIEEMLGDGVVVDVTAAEPLRASRRYEVWIEGHISAAFAALIGVPARRQGRFTIFEAALEQADLYRLLSRVNELARLLVAVRPASSVTAWAGPQTPVRGHLEHTYEFRLAGHVAAELLRPYYDCRVRHEAGHTVIAAPLDQAALGGLLRQLRHIGADLLSVHRKT